ncbi:hypothetical protein QTP70_032598 [Hemibagrus guttatus]|uniref:RING-type domain-containing protein n=1 Tax=Hemibagrus guttatus TaxID=175788 RepID=A0AAE0PTE3_9TELE|nr:hypothetical protein QTP70_032598 [Hemibagrus guttatus]
MKLGQIPSPCPSYRNDQSIDIPMTFSDKIISLHNRELHNRWDSWRCLICKEMLNEIVSIPCGHTFCKTCILFYWEKPSHEKDFSCPHCRKRFKTRPALKINMSLDNILNQTGFSPALPAQSYAGPGDVACDICTGKRRRAVKL